MQGWDVLTRRALENSNGPQEKIGEERHSSSAGSYSSSLWKAASEVLQYAGEARGGGVLGWDFFRGRRARHDRALKRALERAESRRAGDDRGGKPGRGCDDEDELPTGLANQGNTCYLNALLQTIYHAPGLKSAVAEASESGDYEGGETIAALAKVFKDLDERGR